MEVPRLGAYGAIAVGDLQTGRRYDLESDPPAVTASAVRDHLHCRLTSRLWRKVRGAKRHAKFVAHEPAVRRQATHRAASSYRSDGVANNSSTPESLRR